MSKFAQLFFRVLALTLVVGGFLLVVEGGGVSADSGETQLQAVQFAVEDFSGAMSEMSYEIPIIVNADAGESVTTAQIDLNIDPELTGELRWDPPWSILQPCIDTSAENCSAGFNFSGSTGSFRIATLTITTPPDCVGEFPISFDNPVGGDAGESGTAYNGIEADSTSSAIFRCELTSVEMASAQVEANTLDNLAIAILALVTLGGATVFVKHNA